MDDELSEILNYLPKNVTNIPFHLANAYICIRQNQLNIYPLAGGWLGVDIDKLVADIAPFSD